MVLTSTSDATAVAESTADYLIFYSSVKESTNEMWCPVSALLYIIFKTIDVHLVCSFAQDCVRVEDFVKERFEQEDSPSALIVYVGQREE